MSVIKGIEEHFEEQRKGLLQIARRQVGDFWYEDCVQEAYGRALRHAGNKGPIVCIDYYLKYILGTVCREYMQDNLTGDAEELEEWMWESDELEQEFKNHGTVEAVLAELQLLKEPNRSCVYLHAIQGERSKVVSVITGVDEASVRKICQRFREEMKNKYGREE